VLQSLLPGRLPLLVLALVLRLHLDLRALASATWNSGWRAKCFWGARCAACLGAHIHLVNLEYLARCRVHTPNDCWVAIRDACRHLGFTMSRLQLLGESYDEQISAGGRRSAGPCAYRCRQSITLKLRIVKIGCALETHRTSPAFADLLGEQTAQQNWRGCGPSGQPRSTDPAALVGRVESYAAGGK